MTFDQAALIAVLATAVALFISERVRYDLVALATLLVCVLLGLVEPGAAFAGFANDAVITVAAVLVMSHALARSGAVDVVTVPLLKLAPHPLTLMGGLCVIGALLSSFMNNVGALALLMPVAIAGARKGGYSVGLLLMPLSFATLLGGTTTLVGTPPNLLMADLAERLRGEPFTMFDYTPVGAAIAAAAEVELYRQDDSPVRGRELRRCGRARPRARRYAATTGLDVRLAGRRRVAVASRDRNLAGVRQGGAHRARRRGAARPTGSAFG